MTRPTREEMLMEHARVAARRSTCSRASVGVVFALDGRVLVTGYNGAPAGMPHCVHECDCGTLPPLATVHIHAKSCVSNQPCAVSVHAEANAVAWAARHGVRLEGSELYTTFTPCLPCAQLLVNVGITKAYAGEFYRDLSGLKLLQGAGIEVVDWERRV